MEVDSDSRLHRIINEARFELEEVQRRHRQYEKDADNLDQEMEKMRIEGEKIESEVGQLRAQTAQYQAEADRVTQLTVGVEGETRMLEQMLAKKTREIEEMDKKMERDDREHEEMMRVWREKLAQRSAEWEKHLYIKEIREWEAKWAEDQRRVAELRREKAPVVERMEKRKKIRERMAEWAATSERNPWVRLAEVGVKYERLRQEVEAMEEEIARKREAAARGQVEIEAWKREEKRREREAEAKVKAKRRAMEALSKKQQSQQQPQQPKRQTPSSQQASSGGSKAKSSSASAGKPHGKSPESKKSKNKAMAPPKQHPKPPTPPPSQLPADHPIDRPIVHSGFDPETPLSPTRENQNCEVVSAGCSVMKTPQLNVPSFLRLGKSKNNAAPPAPYFGSFGAQVPASVASPFSTPTAKSVLTSKSAMPDSRAPLLAKQSATARLPHSVEVRNPFSPPSSMASPAPPFLASAPTTHSIPPVKAASSFFDPPEMTATSEGTSSLDGVQQDEGDSFALDLSVDNAGDARNMPGLDDLSFNMDFEARDSNHNDGPMNLFGEASGGEGGGDDGGLGANFSFDL